MVSFQSVVFAFALPADTAYICKVLALPCQFLSEKIIFVAQRGETIQGGDIGKDAIEKLTRSVFSYHIG